MSRKNKGYKIESYGRIFDSSSRRRKKRIRNTIVFIIVIALLVFLGYSMAGPLKNLIKGQKTDLPSSSNASAPSEITSSAVASTESQPDFAQDASKIAMAYLPREIASDETRLSAYLDNIKNLGYNSVVIELKDEVGNVYFATQNEMAISAEAVFSAPIDVKALVLKVKEAGLTPVAEIHAFKDRTATKNDDAKIKYRGSENWSWLDGENGKPWLNPYSEAAQSYVTSLATELVDLGFENIMASSVMFPQVASFKYADFGATEQTVSHADILKQFTQALKKALNEKGAALFLCYDSARAKAENNVVYGSANPALSFSADVLVPSISLTVADGTEIAQLVNEIKSTSSEAKLVVKFAPTSVDGLAFTKEQIDAQKSVLTGSGAYICEISGNYIG